MQNNTQGAAALQTENEHLRQHMAALEQALASANQQLDALHTQLEQTQQRLHLLQSVIDASPSVIFALNTQGKHILANQRFLLVLGYTAEQVLGKTAFDILPPEMAQALHEHDSQVLATEQMIEQEVEIPHADGIHIYAESKFPLYDTAGQITAIGGISTDITERKQTEDVLRTFQILVERAPDGITIVGLDGKLTYANPAFQEMCGYGADTVGMHMTQFRPTHEQDGVADVVSQLFEHGVWQGRQIYQHQDGRLFTAQVSAFMIYDEQGEHQSLMGIHRDITEQEEQEVERQHLQQEVIDAQRSTLRQLSTPLIPITDTAVVIPLIGAIDTRRAQQMMETLLDGVARYQSQIAIVDITGVEIVDTQVAQALVQAAQAVRLLGAHVMLTGIQPQIAQTLVQLGVDLRMLDTRSSLQAGIAAVLNGQSHR